MERNKVVIVDRNDNSLGEMDKLLAHERGELHRAFSVFIFNHSGEMLIHQRAADKYHGGGLWTNACCSHPQLQEDLEQGALQRLQYEMGLVCPIRKLFSFIYHAHVENNLIEHEFDHVFVGYTDNNPIPNPTEVQSYRWISVDSLQEEILTFPDTFTYWFKSALDQVIEALEKSNLLTANR
ncbi:MULTISPECIES: isopentenyl-diphosphate Delta-isomerase [Sphingobacterium]|uniref:Isopentenyl-diphosphate delta-isomerase n=1 Tax=Sphingobacterium populi TaxID=1812824 RepID=A0ABW5UGB7_9SPHI|nr:isopentenyl-diphosphate Delta-isomerase [Sphingobacterium sp. CFCC 11742]